MNTRIFAVLIILIFLAGCGDDTQVAQPAGNSAPEFGQQAEPQQNASAQEQAAETTPSLPVCGDAVCHETELGTCEEDCPDCDDSDKCTADSFSIASLSCINKPVKDCCGDGYCGPAEECEADCPVKMMTLVSYPYPFVHGNDFEEDIVVGDLGTASDIAAVTAIAEGLGKHGVIGVLASEVSTIRNKNIILVGNPCTNVFVAQLMGYDEDCLEDYEEGEGRLALFATGESGGKTTYSLVVSGHSGEDVKRAGEILELYEKNAALLKGTTAKV